MKPSQLKSVLTKLIKHGKPVLLVGPPGVGKSEISETVARELGYDILICHPVVDSPIDYKGMPYVSDGKAEFLPFGILNQLIEANSPLLCMFDDLGQACDAVQASLMQLLLSRKINGQKISDHVVFLAATNDKHHKASVSGILEPVKSRFITILKIDIDAAEWIKWGSENNMPTELLDYVAMNPDFLFEFNPTTEVTNSPCPRTVANMGELFNLFDICDESIELFGGAVGIEAAAKFLSFVEIYRRAPRIVDILADPVNCPIPDDVDQSIRTAICTMLTGRVDVSNFDKIITYVKRLGPELTQVVVTGASMRLPELIETKTYVDWTLEYQTNIIH